MKLQEGVQVKLKSISEIHDIRTTLGWDGNDINRLKNAVKLGDKTVKVINPQNHHEYFFTEIGPTVHFSMIKEIVT